MSQLKLNFSENCHASDPITSYEAAERVHEFASRHNEIIFHVLLKHGCLLKNAREKWKLPALKKRKIRSRWVQKPITCLICGVKFMPVNPKNTLCSPQCKRENQRQYDEKKTVAKAKYMREYRKSE